MERQRAFLTDPAWRLTVAVLLLSAAVVLGAEPAINRDQLRPGLVAIYRDDAQPKPTEIVRLEPTIALALGADEAPHPRLSPRGSARWEGYLNIVRAGPYRFRALLRGRFRLTVAGKEVLAAEVAGPAPVLKEGLEQRLEAGPQAIVAEFTRLPGPARLEVFWESNAFRSEPLPHDPLRHRQQQIPPRLADDAASDRGRFLVEEHNCLACHRPATTDRLAAGLLGRRGPDLSQVGGRVRPGWIYRWLEAPHEVRPGAVMPQMFSADEAGRVERYAVTRYLASLGGPLPVEKVDLNRARQYADRGRRLFNSIGCVACHGQQSKAQAPDTPSFIPAPSSIPLGGLGRKTTPGRLVAYLANPLAVDSSGRMPHMLLQGNEARDLAYYLCEDGAADNVLPDAPGKPAILAALRRLALPDAEVAAFERLAPEQQLLDLGRRLVISKGCTSCHTVAPRGQAFPSASARASFNDIKQESVHSRGCLADDASRRGAAPRFMLNDKDRASVRRFLAAGTAGVGSPAPAFDARIALQRFNCLACHVRDGEGGLTPAVIEELRRYENAENAEAVIPPPLTGVAHRLRTPWLRQVLTQAGRARPWMALRMPQFGEANVGRLPEGLAALEGTTPDDKAHAVPLTPGKIDAGRHLVGKSAFGCISCHDLAGIPNHGTRGPDLALMHQRVRYDWYLRWLEQPQRIQPGTRMPSVFANGQSTLPGVLGGSADAQAEAMWAYLSLGPGLPLPEGLEPPKGLTLTVKDRPIVLRTFMPQAGSKAVAVGYPGGVSVAFDAATCRLAYAWSGNFLDASPVWNDRGGQPARVLGVRFWTSPPGCAWGTSASQEPPDFASRIRDPAYGTPLPEGKVYNGPRQVVFLGYSVDRAGLPTFRYRVGAAEAHPLEVAERPEPLRSGGGPGVSRHFTVKAPAGQTAWLFAAQAVREPRLLDAKGGPQALDLKNGNVLVPVASHLLLPQEGDRVVVLAVREAPTGTAWQLRRNGGWEVLLRLPPASGEVNVKLQVWAPYRDDLGLIKEMVGGQ